MSIRAKRKKRALQIILGLAGLGVLLWGLQCFHALTAPVGAEVLVLEGWFPRHPAVVEAAEQFQAGAYTRLLVVGVPASDEPDAACDADAAAARLLENGVPADRLMVLRAPYVTTRRTLASANAVRDWLLDAYPSPPRSVDVFTLGTHARRSRLLFRMAMDDQATVGVIAGKETKYPPALWYLSFGGWHCMIQNSAGLLLRR